MPSPMKFYGSDPIKMGRGKGYYYLRGGYKRGWMSKYTGEHDASYRPSRNKKKLTRAYEHTGDTDRMKRRTHKVQRTPRKYVFLKGFF